MHHTLEEETYKNSVHGAGRRPGQETGSQMTALQWQEELRGIQMGRKGLIQSCLATECILQQFEVLPMELQLQASKKEAARCLDLI